MSDVFISYSRRDIAFARLIREALQESEIDTWIDWERIPVGERWWQEITQAIENANVFMFIISQHSIGSKVCRDEIDLALKHHKRIIPILVDEMSPEDIQAFVPELPQYNWIIFQRDQIFSLEEIPSEEGDQPGDSQVALPKRPQFEDALARLNTAIHTDWEWVKYHTRLQVDALRWENNAADPSYLIGGTVLEEGEQRLFQASGKQPQPTELQVKFVTASRQQETLLQNEKLNLEKRSRQRQRLALWAVALGLIVASTLGAVAWGQRNQYLTETHVRATAESNAVSEAQARATAQVNAEIASTEAVGNFQRSERLRLSAEAENLLSQPYGNVETVALLSLRAIQGVYLPQADAALQKSLPHLFAVRQFVGHADAVISVAFSPDRKYLLTGSMDHTAMLWDVATNTVVRTFSGHSGSVESVAFSPDGRYVLTGSADKTAKLWDISADKELHTFSDPPRVKRTSVELKRSCHSVAFSPDGKFVLTASDDGDARLWDAASGEMVRRFTGHTNIVRSVAFSSDGEYVLTGGLDNTVRLWDVTTGDELNMFSHATWVYSVAFSPDGKYVLTWTKNAVLWNIETGLVERTFGEDVAAALSLAFSPDGKYLVTAHAGQALARLWDVNSGTLVRNFSGHTNSVEAVAFSADGNYVVTGSQDGTAKLWNATSSALGRTFREHSNGVNSVAFSPDGKFVLTSSDDGTARLWDAVTYSEVRTFSGHTEAIWAAAFSPDGKYVLTGSLDDTARLWDASNGALVRTFTGHSNDVWSVAFSPDGKQVLTGSYDHIAKLWDAATGTELHTLKSHTQGVKSVAFSPDGKYALTGSIDWDAKLWDAKTGAEVRTFKEQSSIQVVDFSPDGKYMLTGNYGLSSVTLWDISNGTVIQSFTGHTDSVIGVAFSPDGKYVLTGSYDKTAKLWDITTGEELRTFVGHTDAVIDVDFSPDGKYALTGSADQTAQLWDIDPNDTIQWACAHLTRDLTPEERTRYFITDDTPTCQNLGQGAVAVLPTTMPFTTPLPFPTSTPVMPTPIIDVYLFDDFTDNSNDWPVGVVDDDWWVGTRLIEKGLLDVKGVSLQGMSAFFYPNQGGNLSNQQVSVSVNLANPKLIGAYGLVLREKNDSFYAFYIDGDGFFSFWLFGDGQWKPLVDWKENPYMNIGGWNRMAVQATGSHFKIFFNDNLLAEVDDDSLSSGRSGLIFQTHEAGEVFHIQFDDFEIRLQYD